MKSINKGTFAPRLAAKLRYPFCALLFGDHICMRGPVHMIGDDQSGYLKMR